MEMDVNYLRRRLDIRLNLLAHPGSLLEVKRDSDQGLLAPFGPNEAQSESAAHQQ